MNQHESKKCISKRRLNIKFLRQNGFTIEQIARYFEVRPEAVLSSLNNVTINADIIRNSKRDDNSDFNELLKTRDGLKKSGFYKKPSFYNVDNIILEELLCGFKMKTIAQYNNCMQQNVSALNQQYIDFVKEAFNEREQIANELLGDGWSLSDVCEFTGLAISRIEYMPNAPRERKDIKNKEGSLYYKRSGRSKEVAELFINGFTQQEIADKLQLTRTTVASYLRIAEQTDANLKKRLGKIKKTAKPKKLKRQKFKEQYTNRDKIREILTTKYTDEQGFLNQTQREIAKELGISEQVIQEVSKNANIKAKKFKIKENKGVESF